MRQHPPTGPDDESGRTADSPDDTAGPDDTAATSDSAAAETEALDQSPYDVPAPETTELPAAYPADGYGQAPNPGGTIYSGASSIDPEVPEEPGEGRPKWLVPLIVIIILLIAGGIAAALLLGGDSDAPGPVPAGTSSPTVEESTGAEPSDEPSSAEPSDEPSSAEPSDEPSSAEPTDDELIDSLEDSVSVGDDTFKLTDAGWEPAKDTQDAGADEAYEGVFAAGDDEIQMLATLWPDNKAADEFAADLVDDLDGAEEVESGDTYTNGKGTYWAFLLDDGDGSYIWTTDRGHVLQVTGSTDFVGNFYSNFPL